MLPKPAVAPGNHQPPASGDAFVPGGYTGWQPPTVPPGLAPETQAPVWCPLPDAPGSPFPAYAPPPGFQPLVFVDPGKLGHTTGDLKKPGSLVVVDQFIAPMPMMGIGGMTGSLETPHGHLVSESATHDGFSGNLIPSEISSKYGQEKFMIKQSLNEPGLPPEEFKKRLELSVALESVSLMDSMSERLEGLKEAGLHGSAVNLSYGISQAGILDRFYSDASLAWAGWGPTSEFKKPLLENYARAFDLDASKLSHQDPKIAGPERRKLQQAIADQVSGTMETHPAVQESHQNYAKAVIELEKDHNSVVVSAANYGRVVEYLDQDAGESAPKLRVSSQFHDNVLATPETTVVGATDGSGDQEKVAGYSSNFQEVDIYANGVAPKPSLPGQKNAQGTSFAAPKVAQAMAQLHELYPEKSSAEIEDMLKEQLSHQLLSYDGNVQRPVLNEQPDFGMLSLYT
ncbi:MAG: S8/S53 family peptidase [Candidatus Eremiobacteraeota bacterium]|nr:S8/S53 family peptidase [Candidatus Eremiobacteraeota bacterium]MCW5866569.1 S8/S53 family peptidase [Candidatus Eremiobacteraeota bacterium]